MQVIISETAVSAQRILTALPHVPGTPDRHGGNIPTSGSLECSARFVSSAALFCLEAPIGGNGLDKNEAAAAVCVSVGLTRGPLSTTRTVASRVHTNATNQIIIYWWLPYCL